MDNRDCAAVVRWVVQAAVACRFAVGERGPRVHLVQRLGFRVQGLGFMVHGLGFWVQGLGFRVVTVSGDLSTE